MSSPHKDQAREQWDQEIQLLRGSTGIREADVRDYTKTEILRKSIGDVHYRAAVQAEKRLSPRKYSAVKSKVAGNMRSQRLSKKRSNQIAVAQAQADEEERAILEGRSGNSIAYVVGNHVEVVTPARSSVTTHVARTYSPTSKKIEQRLSQIEKREQDLQRLADEFNTTSWTQRRSMATASSTTQPKVTTTVRTVSSSPPKVSTTFSQKIVHHAPVQEVMAAQEEEFKSFERQEKREDSPAAELNESVNIVTHSNDGPQVEEGSAFFQEKRSAKKKIAAVSYVNDEEQPVRVLQDEQPEQEVRTKVIHYKSPYKQDKKRNSYYKPRSGVSPRKQTQTGLVYCSNVRQTHYANVYDLTAPTPSVPSSKKQRQFVTRLSSGASPKKSISPAKRQTAFQRGQQQAYICPPEPEARQIVTHVASPKRSSPVRATAVKTQVIRKDYSGLPKDHKFRNHNLEARTAEIQAEFNALLNDRTIRCSSPSKDLKMDDFYTIMGDFYEAGPEMRKHASPTKRLIKQKDAAFDHKQIFKNHSVKTQQYGLTYITSPTKSYVIEPQGGELNYEMAYKSPLKFYDRVMSQDITQHKVAKSKDEKYQERRVIPLELTSRVTKRAIGRILYAVQDKLVDLMREAVGPEGQEWLEQAFKDTAVKHVVQKHVAQQGIQLVHKDSNEPIFRREMTRIGEVGDRVLNDSPDERNPSPTHALEDANLEIDNSALEEVKTEVVEFIRRKSTLKEAEMA